jgi:hypothetical protein cdivTM_30108
MFSLLFGLFILGTTPKVEATTFQDNSISVIRNIKNIGAQDLFSACDQATGAAKEYCNSKKASGKTTTSDSLVKLVMNTMFYIVGIVSIVMIIYGGMKYTTSSGDPKKVASAKATILYAVIGLIVALFAVAIVQFVSTRIK